MFKAAISIALAGAVLASATYVSAEDEVSCGEVGELAASVMSQRQSGDSFQTTLDAHQPSAPKRYQEAFEAMVIMAYEQPFQLDKERKERAIADYRDSVQIGCFKARKESDSSPKPPA
jgi:hypothetical protein